jgi:ribosomal protein S20
MPIIKSAKKKMRQDKKRYAKNLRVKRDLKNAVKAFNAKPTFDGLKSVQSRIDTAVKKNVLKKNTGARQMAQMSRIAKEAGVKIPKSKSQVASSKSPVTTAKPIAKKTVATKKSTVTKKSVTKPATKKTAKK